MDNLGAHKGPGRARSDRGARRPVALPAALLARSEPIEQAFAKLKALLRTAATRTVDTLWHALGHALDAFSPAECARYLAHAGYVPSNR
jgi:transposase